MEVIKMKREIHTHIYIYNKKLKREKDCNSSKN